MAENLDKYEAVLADLREERRALDNLIAALEARINAKRGASGQGTLLTPVVEHQNGYAGPTVSDKPITLYEGSEKILRAVGKPLHAKFLVLKLAEMGKITTVNSLAGSLGQDPKKRFERVERGTFGLTEWSKKGEKT
ncbi:MAG TPA: HTH domain-containing protein [Pyrinomonadaceae bacterium]|nr:HTH domain-containing protein [Pyrinomonadaceae bacterium]